MCLIGTFLQSVCEDLKGRKWATLRIIDLCPRRFDQLPLLGLTIDEISRSLRIDERVVFFPDAFASVWDGWDLVHRCISAHTDHPLHGSGVGLDIHFAIMIEWHAHIAALMMEGYEMARGGGHLSPSYVCLEQYRIESESAMAMEDKIK